MRPSGVRVGVGEREEGSCGPRVCFASCDEEDTAGESTPTLYLPILMLGESFVLAWIISFAFSSLSLLPSRRSILIVIAVINDALCRNQESDTGSRFR